MLSIRKLALKPFILFCHSRRERRRFGRNFPTRWLSQDSLVSDDLAAHVEVEGKEAVGPDFLERMVGARDAAVKKASMFRTASISITAYFLLAILSIDLPISVFGVSLVRVGGLNELLLISSSIMGAFAAFYASKTATLEAAIKAAININYKPPMANFYRAAYLPNDYAFLFYPTYSPHLVWGALKLKHSFASIAAALVFIFAVLVSVLVFRAYVTWWVWSSPSTENLLLNTLIWLSPLLDVASFLFLLPYIVPMPHRDYFKLHQLEALKDYYPAAAMTLKAELYDEGSMDRIRLRNEGFLPPFKQ